MAENRQVHFPLNSLQNSHFYQPKRDFLVFSLHFIDTLNGFSHLLLKNSGKAAFSIFPLIFEISVPIFGQN